MSAPFTYLEQAKLHAAIDSLQRENEDLRWALASRADYEAELARLTAEHNRLVLLVAEDESDQSPELSVKVKER